MHNLKYLPPSQRPVGETTGQEGLAIWAVIAGIGLLILFGVAISSGSNSFSSLDQNKARAATSSLLQFSSNIDSAYFSAVSNGGLEDSLFAGTNTNHFYRSSASNATARSNEEFDLAALGYIRTNIATNILAEAFVKDATGETLYSEAHYLPTTGQLFVNNLVPEVCLEINNKFDVPFQTVLANQVDAPDTLYTTTLDVGCVEQYQSTTSAFTPKRYAFVYRLK